MTVLLTFIFNILFLSTGSSWAAEDPARLEFSPSVTLPEIEVKSHKRATAFPEAEFERQSVELGAHSETTISEALARLPSLMPQASGSESSSAEFMIRGQDSIQNRFFLDGIPLTDAEYNQTNLNLVPFSALKSLDVYPEGTPLFLGSDGLSGSANLILKSPVEDENSDFGTKFGSYNFAQAFGRATTRSPWPASLALEITRSDEDFIYFDDNQTPFNPSDDRLAVRSHNSFQRITALPQVSLLNNSRQKLSLFSLNSFSRTEIPGAVHLPVNGVLAEIYSLSALQYKASNGEKSDWQNNLFFGYDSNNLSDSDSAIALVPSRSLNLNGGVRTHYQYQWNAYLQSVLVVGLNANRFQISVPDGQTSQTAQSRWELPIGSELNWKPIGSLTVRSGILGHAFYYDSSSQNNPFGLGTPSPGPRSYFLVSPRLGTEWRPTPALKLRSSLGSFYRAPTLYEIYGSPIGVSPSRNLTYESALKAELGAELIWKKPLAPLRRISLGYSYYASHANNLITYVQNSSQTRTAINVGESVVYGHELMAEAESVWGLKLRAGGEFMWTENLSNIDNERGKELPNRPPYRWLSELAFTNAALDLVYQFTVIGPSYWDLPNIRLMNAATDHSVYLTLRTKRWGSVGLEIKNLLNQITATSSFGTIQTVGSNGGFLGYPVPGRRIYVLWKYELG